MKYRFTYESLLPLTFILGILLAYISPFKLEFLKIVASLFTSFFFISAPIFIFIILTYSLSIRAGNSRIANYTIILFFIVCFTISIITATILSLSRGFSTGFSIPSLMLLEVAMEGLLKPIPISIALGIVFSLTIIPRFDVAKKIVTILNRVIMYFLKMIVKVLPVVSISFGVSFYYSLGGYSILAYTEALMLMLIFSFSYILIIILITAKFLNIGFRRLISYFLKIMAAGISLPSSYILLPVHLKIFNDHFKIDRSIGDTVIALGAALNRAGSIIGVILSISIVSKYMNVQVDLVQYIVLAIAVAIVGFASPGIPGGTILVAMPVIMSIINVYDTAMFSITSIATFNGITILTAPTNAVITGCIALIVERFLAKL
ncbi:MAG: cation:dicarboxylase symporter family transporter [Candidatus Methanomethylicia archaeon]